MTLWRLTSLLRYELKDSARTLAENPPSTREPTRVPFTIMRTKPSKLYKSSTGVQSLYHHENKTKTTTLLYLNVSDTVRDGEFHVAQMLAMYGEEWAQRDRERARGRWTTQFRVSILISIRHLKNEKYKIHPRCKRTCPKRHPRLHTAVLSFKMGPAASNTPKKKSTRHSPALPRGHGHSRTVPYRSYHSFIHR